MISLLISKRILNNINAKLSKGSDAKLYSLLYNEMTASCSQAEIFDLDNLMPARYNGRGYFYLSDTDFRERLKQEGVGLC